MTWQIAIAIHLAFSTTFALGQRHIAKNRLYSPALTTALMYLLTITPVGIIWAASTGLTDFGFSKHIWFVLPVSGLLFALANIFAFWANEKIDAAQFNVISNLRNLVTVFISSIFLSEVLTIKQLAGGLLLVAGAIFISANGFSKKSRKVNQYTFVAFASAAFMGSAISLEKYVLDFVNFETYLVVGWSAQTIAMTIIALPQFKEVSIKRDKKKLLSIFALGLLRTFAGFMLVKALILSDNSSLIAVMTSIKAPLVFIAALILLKERADMRRKVAGVSLAVVGLLLML